MGSIYMANGLRKMIHDTLGMNRARLLDQMCRSDTVGIGFLAFARNKRSAYERFRVLIMTLAPIIDSTFELLKAVHLSSRSIGLRTWSIRSDP